MPNSDPKTDWAKRMEDDIAEIKTLMRGLLERTNVIGEQGRSIDRAFEETKAIRAEVEKQDERHMTRYETMNGRVVLLEQLAVESRWVTRGAAWLIGAVMTGLVGAILILVLRQPLPLPDRYVAPVPPAAIEPARP